MEKGERERGGGQQGTLKRGKMGTSGPSTRGKREMKGAKRAKRIRSRKTRKADGRVGCMRQECPRASPELVRNNCEVVIGERSVTMDRK